MAATPADPLALERQVCFALAVASRTVISAYRPVLEPYGLTHPQYLVMLALWQHEPLSIRRLAELLSLEPATVSPLVKRLEAIGYVSRARSANDERSLDVRLTAEGRQLRSKATAIPGTMMKRLDISPEELTELHRAMSTLITAAKKASAAG